MEFQNIMTEIYNPYIDYIIIYIDDIFYLFDNIDQHFKHLNIFIEATKRACLTVNNEKVKFFQTKIKFLGNYIENGITIPIKRAIIFADKFPDKITDLNKLQRFLGSLNYVGDFYKYLAQDCKLIFQRLKKNLQPLTNSHTLAIEKIRERIKEFSCLAIANPEAFKLVETNASEIGYGGVLKQKMKDESKEIFVKYTSEI